MLKSFIIAMCIHGLMNIVFALQYAYGYSKLMFFHNISLVVVMFPLMYFLIKNYGVVGASFFSLFVNFSYLFINVFYLHRKVLKKELKRWYFENLFIPLLTSFFIVYIFKMFLIENFANPFSLIFLFSLTFFASFSIYLVFFKTFRDKILKITKLFKKRVFIEKIL